VTVLITGDRRLPELLVDTRIERYQVPLIVYSPLLKQPRAIKAAPSQFDIAPSLLAFLGHGDGLRAPDEVTWIGTGLDTEPAFRNLVSLSGLRRRPGGGETIVEATIVNQGGTASAAFVPRLVISDAGGLRWRDEASRHRRGDGAQ